MENPIKMDDLGGKPTIFGNTHMYNDRMLSPSPAWMERGLGREASDVFPFRRGFSVATVCVFSLGGLSWAKHNTNEQCNDTIMMEEIRKDLGSQFWNVSHNLVVFFLFWELFVTSKKPTTKRWCFWWSVSGIFCFHISLPQKTPLFGAAQKKPQAMHQGIVGCTPTNVHYGNPYISSI